jgi:hypothetical protein
MDRRQQFVRRPILQQPFLNNVHHVVQGPRHLHVNELRQRPFPSRSGGEVGSGGITGPGSGCGTGSGITDPSSGCSTESGGSMLYSTLSLLLLLLPELLLSSDGCPIRIFPQGSAMQA